MRSRYYEHRRHPRYTGTGRFLRVVLRLLTSTCARQPRRLFVQQTAMRILARRGNLAFLNAVQEFGDGAIVQSELVWSVEIE